MRKHRLWPWSAPQMVADVHRSVDSANASDATFCLIMFEVLNVFYCRF